MVNFDRTSAVKTARAFFDKPCSDKLVYTLHKGFNTDHLLREAGRSKDVAKFAWYDVGNRFKKEGLFAFDAGDSTDTDTKILGIGDFDTINSPLTRNTKCPRLLIAWSDLPDQEPLYVRQLRPPHAGLNDCAHFVSTCLISGSLLGSIETLVDPLFEKLKRLGGIVLAENVAAAQAQKIMGSGLLKGGDVCFFTNLHPKKAGFERHHSAIVLGEHNSPTSSTTNHNVACHTTRYAAPIVAEDAATVNVHHPFVSFIHFPFDDEPRGDRGFTWIVTWRNQKYWYRFNAKGAVGYKAVGSSKPEETYDDTGYWRFVGNRIVICWSETGSIEAFFSEKGELKGRWNGLEDLEVATFDG